jgi:hypothetical protein
MTTTGRFAGAVSAVFVVEDGKSETEAVGSILLKADAISLLAVDSAGDDKSTSRSD